MYKNSCGMNKKDRKKVYIKMGKKSRYKIYRKWYYIHGRIKPSNGAKVEPQAFRKLTDKRRKIGGFENGVQTFFQRGIYGKAGKARQGNTKNACTLRKRSRESRENGKQEKREEVNKGRREGQKALPKNQKKGRFENEVDNSTGVRRKQF